MSWSRRAMARMALRGPIVLPPTPTKALKLAPVEAALEQLEEGQRTLSAVEKLEPHVRAALERPFSRPMTAPCEVRLVPADWVCPLCYGAVSRKPKQLRTDCDVLSCGPCDLHGALEESERGGSYIQWRRGTRR